MPNTVPHSVENSMSDDEEDPNLTRFSGAFNTSQLEGGSHAARSVSNVSFNS